MKLTLDLLERSKNTREIISLVKYNDEETVWCGYVIDFSEQYVILQHFTKFGKNDGIIIHPLGDVQRIDFNDDFCNAMQCIIDYSEEIYKPGKFKLVLGLSENVYLDQLKNFQGDNDTIISVQIDSEQYATGYVVDTSEEDFALLCVGKMGEDLGISIFKVDDITNLQIDDLDNRKRNLLFKWRKSTL